MSSVPKLETDGTVAFDSKEAHRSAYEPYLSKGGLMVGVSEAPAPLSTLEVRLTGGYLQTPVQLSCQVVAVFPGRAILHIQDFGPELAEALKPRESDPPAAQRPLQGAANDAGPGFMLVDAPVAIHAPSAGPAPLQLTPAQAVLAPAAPAPAFALLEVPPASSRDSAPAPSESAAPAPVAGGFALLDVPPAKATLRPAHEPPGGAAQPAPAQPVPGAFALLELSPAPTPAPAAVVGAFALLESPGPATPPPTDDPFAPTRPLTAPHRAAPVSAPVVGGFGLLEVPPATARDSTPAPSAALPRALELTPADLAGLPETPPPSGQRSPAALPPVPPILEGGDLLMFQSAAEFHAARADWEASASLVAACGVAPKEERKVQLTLQVGGYLHAQGLPAVVEPATARTVSLGFGDRAALAGWLAGVAARLPASVVPRSAPASQAAPGSLRPSQLTAEAPPPPVGRLQAGALCYPGAAEFLAAPKGGHGALSVGAFANPPPNLGQTIEADVLLGSTLAGRLRFQVAYVAPGYVHLLSADVTEVGQVLAQARAQVGEPAGPARPPTSAPPRPGTLGSLPASRPHGGASQPATGAFDPFAPVAPVVSSRPTSTPAIPFPALSTAAVLGVATPQRWGLPLQGAFTNPATPEAFLSMSLVQPPTQAELASPSAALMLRWLCGVPGQQLLTLTVAGKAYEVGVSAGLELRLPVPPESLARLMAEPQGTYALAPASGPPRSARTTHRTRALLAEVLRMMLRRFAEPQLQTALSFKAAQSPRLSERGVALVPSLGLAQGVQRTARRMLDGQYRVDEIIHSGAGARGGWELLYLLDLLGGLDWVEPPARVVDAVDPVEARWKAMEGKDHFEVLGLHWSSAPRSIEPAFQQLRAQFAAGSSSDASSPAAAARIRARVEEAWRVLQRRDTRVNYRREALPGVQFAYQVEVMITQARLAGMRGEFVHARELLEGAMDVAPSPEVKTELDNLRDLEARARAKKG